MDGLNEYKDDPTGWAIAVILDHISEDQHGKIPQAELEKILDDCYDFIVDSFLEEGIDCPKKVDLISQTFEVAGKS